MLPGLFYMEFSLDYHDPSLEGALETYAFVITPEGMAEIDVKGEGSTPDERYSTFIQDHAEDLESEYGVHDYGSAPDPRVVAAGYGSYEIERSRIDDLMRDWRNIHVAQAGDHNVSQVVKLPTSLDLQTMTDWDIYEATVQATLENPA